MFTKEQIASLCATLLEMTRDYLDRHNEERYIGQAQTTLTEQQIHELIRYRWHLRYISDRATPADIPPSPPSFCKEAMVVTNQFLADYYQRAADAAARA